MTGEEQTGFWEILEHGEEPLINKVYEGWRDERRWDVLEILGMKETFDYTWILSDPAKSYF